MRRLGFLVSVLTSLFVAVVVSTEARVGELVPCCEGGQKANKSCKNDDDCPGRCQGGFRDGQPCASAGCPSACVGGFDEGGKCTGDFDCRSTCVGGKRDGLLCDPSGRPGCPGGSCGNVGSCSDIGECVTGTCTALCPGRGRKKSPSGPVYEFPELLVAPETNETAAGPACP